MEPEKSDAVESAHDDHVASSEDTPQASEAVSEVVRYRSAVTNTGCGVIAVQHACCRICGLVIPQSTHLVTRLLIHNFV